MRRDFDVVQGLQLFFELIPSFSITLHSQRRVRKALGEAQQVVARQPALVAWATEHGLDHLQIDLVLDEYRQRPFTLKSGPSGAGHAIRVRTFRESWVEAPMTAELSRACVFLIVLDGTLKSPSSGTSCHPSGKADRTKQGSPPTPRSPSSRWPASPGSRSRGRPNRWQPVLRALVRIFGSEPNARVRRAL